jgi:hypothetical protein
MIEIESIREQIVTRLPVRAQWLISGTSLDFDFSPSQGTLHPVTTTDVVGDTVEEQWTSLRIFGQQDYAEGGGASPYLTVDADTGEIFGLDVERTTSQLFLLNSNIDRFIQTFLALDRMLHLGGLPDADIAARLKTIDPDAFERSDWRVISDHVTE